MNFDNILGIEFPADEEEVLPGPTVGNDTGIATEIIANINDEYETINKYNQLIANLKDHPEFILVIQDIVSEEMNHVGMLQTLLKRISPNTENIQNGEIEANELLLNEDLELNEANWRLNDSPFEPDFVVEGIIIDPNTHEVSLNCFDVEEQEYFEKWLGKDDVGRKNAKLLLKDSAFEIPTPIRNELVSDFGLDDFGFKFEEE